MSREPFSIVSIVSDKKVKDKDTRHFDNAVPGHYLGWTEGKPRMARTSTHLNFMGKTEKAFNFYRAVFRTEFAMPIQRMSDVPAAPGMPELGDAEKKMVIFEADDFGQEFTPELREREQRLRLEVERHKSKP